MSDLLRLVANPMNQAILNCLALQPSYPRQIAQLTEYSESEVTRRLRAMEKAGIVSATWGRAAGTVRLYRLLTSGIEVEFAAHGTSVQVKGLSLPSGRQIPPPPPIPVADGFLGRVDELARMDTTPVVLVEGLPGVGKTSLVATFAATQESVVWLTCTGHETPRWFLQQVAFQLARQGDATALDVLDTPEAQTQVLSMMDRPDLVWILDDTHKITSPEVHAWLAAVIRHTRQAKVILMGRKRYPHPQANHITRIELGGLAEGDAVAFLTSRGFDVPEHLAERVRIESGGHPLALELLAEAARGPGLEPLLDAKPEEALIDYLLDELDPQLTDLERSVLGNASLFAQTFFRQDLEALLGRKLEGALMNLRRRHLVRRHGEGYRLHEVVRNFYYHRLQDRKARHAKAAKQCRTWGTPAGRLECLHHLLAADDRPGVIELLKEDLDLHDFHALDPEYHTMYASMLHAMKDDEMDPAIWSTIQDELGDLSFHLKRWEEALSYYDACKAECPEEKLGDLEWKRAQCLEHLGRKAEALEAIESGLQQADQSSKKRLQKVQERLS